MRVTARKAAWGVLFAACLFVLCGARPVAASENDLSGTWKVDHLFDTIIASIEQDGNALRGVLTVTSPFGAKDVYHFTGKCENGRIEASHRYGHVFRGESSPDGRISGELTTRKGLHLSIKAKRLTSEARSTYDGTVSIP